MKAIVFGAGKIARGFIGQLLYLSKADITFVDIDQQLVDRLNKDQKYHVYILGDSSLDSDVTGFQACLLYTSFPPAPDRHNSDSQRQRFASHEKRFSYADRIHTSSSQS